MQMRAKTSGHVYHVISAGTGSRLLLLHGFTGSAESWRPLLPGLAQEFQLVCPDILGHGKSDKPRDAASYRMEAAAADMVDLLDQLGVETAHLLGYSMGGRLAVFLALAYPQRFRSLVLESASPGLADGAERGRRRQADEDLANRIMARGIRWFVDYWESLPLWASQSRLRADVLEAQRQQRLQNEPLALANSLRGMGAGAQPSLWSRLNALSMPTLLLAGEYDDKFRAIHAAMAERIPDARLAVLPGAGHRIHLEQPAVFTRAITSFWQSLQS